MNRKSASTLPNTTSISGSTRFVTVIHPFHPLYGQRVRIVRINRSKTPTTIIRHPEGFDLCMDLDWTDHKNASSETFQETKISLLSEECLNGMLRLLERMKSEGRFKCDNQEVEEQTLSLQFDPHTDETGFFELGHLYFQTKQYELAAEIFETVIKCECSLSKLAIEFLFDCLYELGDRGKELAERSILMSIAPDLAQIIINNSVKSPSD